MNRKTLGNGRQVLESIIYLLLLLTKVALQVCFHKNIGTRLDSSTPPVRGRLKEHPKLVKQFVSSVEAPSSWREW